MIFNFILLFFSLFSLFKYNNPPDMYAKSEYYLNKVLKRTISKIQNKHNLTLSAIGGGTDDQGIWLVNLMFDRRGKPIEIEEARFLIVDCLKELLSDLNSEEKLRPYLKSYPLNPSNINLSIFFYYKNGENIVFPFLSVADSCQGEISFKKDDDSNRYKYKFELFESYEKALEILNSSNQITQDKSS